ncbi:MAG: Stage sporulation family protein [Paenibacillaceae bacterium]|jgi:serine phosphatase RsbU (regulator of sigma subunit)|nr:Stage sporulation family protein [Paenibacillaceae bacterium]
MKQLLSKKTEDSGKAVLYGYDRSVYKVIGLASVLIVFSMLLTGTLGYVFTKNGVVSKLKNQDLGTIAKSIGEQLDGRIERAKETAITLADDPLILRWVTGGEQDGELTEYAMQKLGYLHESRAYNSSFVVSAVSSQYWSESGSVIDKVSSQDPDDAWFYHTLGSNMKVAVNIDYNSVRKDTSAFINALVGDRERPLGVAGVGMSLKELSAEFQTYKYGKGSHVWLVNAEGKVLLSDVLEHNGMLLKDLASDYVFQRVQAGFGGNAEIMEITGEDGELTDLISYPLRSTDHRLLVLIQRQETVSFLGTIKNNTIIALFISIISIVFMFYVVSSRLANPYKRALQLNQELETVVTDRTRELALRNEEIMDSIGYAKRIQENVLPSEEKLEDLLQEHFVIWQPKDVVGGDFYWARPYGQGCLIALGDCTGHGVPGAIMTMLSVAMLDRIVDKNGDLLPGEILMELNRMLKTTLRQEERGMGTDDGLALGLCRISEGKLQFAGAACPLFVRQTDGSVVIVEPDRRGIGYRRTAYEHPFAGHELELTDGVTFYMGTDGLFDQNGGPKALTYGKSRFADWLKTRGGQPLSEQEGLFLQEIAAYQGGLPRRDDLTVMGFRCKQI